MRLTFIGIGVGLICAVPARAQVTPLSRDDAVQMALARGIRLGVAAADTAVARANLVAARALPNPTLAASYSKSLPNYHFTADFPFDFPWLRRSRILSAEAGVRAAGLRFGFVRAMIGLDADTTYTKVLAARAHEALSRRNAFDGDSLLSIAIARRNAGDASELDVELARVFAGQQHNLHTADSLTLISSLLDLQTILGMAADQITIRPTDSLTAPPSDGVTLAGAPTLSVAAASSSLAAAELSARLARRSIFGVPTVSVGWEQGDPSEPGILPTFGLSIGIPLFDRNRGPIAVAEAERERARAELLLAQVESRIAITRAERERANALTKLQRDAVLITSANRVASMSLTAYREGASPLATVLEAQRNAREVIGQYVDDLAKAWIAIAELRVLNLTVIPSPPPGPPR